MRGAPDREIDDPDEGREDDHQLPDELVSRLEHRIVGNLDRVDERLDHQDEVGDEEEQEDDEKRLHHEHVA
jgi:hypothetical protein